jgi:homoserine O-acetyltransferase
LPARAAAHAGASRGTPSPGTRSRAIRRGRAGHYLRHRQEARRRHGRRPHGRPHHISVCRIARRKFSRRLQFCDDIRYTLTEPEFEVESYLRIRPIHSCARFDANTYLYTSRALTYFDLARQHGGGSLANAFRDISARTLLIAFSSDWLYPPSGSEEIAAALGALGKDVELHVIDAPYGHDCFLLEEARQTPLIQRFLNLP